MGKTQTPVFINPLTDFGFKLLFSDKEIAIACLNDITPWELIVDVEYKPTEQLGAVKEDRRVVFDLYCITENKEHYIIEMLVAKQNYFGERVLFYSAFAIRKQGKRGKYWKYGLKGVYLVAVLDFIWFTDAEDKDFVIETVTLTRERTKVKFSNTLNFLFIELPKFNKTLKELETNTDKWLYCLKHMKWMDVIPDELKGSIHEQMLESGRIDILTPTEMEAYNKSILEYNDVRNVADYALERGIEKGREEGILEGIEKGRVEFAKKGLLKGMSIGDIAELTELSPEQIREIALTIQPVADVK
jgi:predicted transposase/invertase (TIGR01784 family)